ncbi:aminotransferase class I/II-fold pyridoxal phosphate-dependent enzyme [Sulfitobacter sp.]|jgi:8-amino-7-oxononanoate synthase|uniref:aminotransferase class I/II-fold pyridoxal phosphate-dependent enzyme n=1 Tax=Sulfitobacter sp. TaxID=1903071 RepID=UPI003564243F
MRSRKPPLSAADRARALSAVRGMGQASPSPTKSPAFDAAAGYKERQVLRQMSSAHGIGDPTFRQLEGRPSVVSDFEGRDVLNFGSYDYLGLNADPRPGNAAKDAIDRYGVSASASRLAGGQRPIHRELETALARHYGVEDAMTFVSGHATNVSVISTITQKDDLIIYDAYIHNSASVGAELSAASRRSFPHNDLDALEALLEENAGQYRATLVVVEGHYSMDGDIPDLKRLLALKAQFGFWLMVDEAHGLGCVGATGKGIREVYNVAGTEVDIWMGTLSKTLGSTGGYVAGSAALIDIIKYEAPGSVYSVALSPPLAAAAACSLSIMTAEPERVAKLHALGRFFLESAAAHGLDTGTSIGSSIIPVIIGNSAIAVTLSMKLLERGIHVLPIAFPGVPMNAARLRFFLTCDHTEAQISHALAETANLLAQLRNSPLADIN